MDVKALPFLRMVNFFVNRKCLRDRYENAINKQKSETKMQDMAGKNFAPLRQIGRVYIINSVLFQ